MKKALSVALALSMVIGATMTSFAANGEITHVKGKPKYDAFGAAQPGPKGLITAQPEKFVVEWGGKYYSIKEIIDYIKANPGKVMRDAVESGTLTEQSKPGETDVLVASISAVNKTTVNVEFTKKPEKPLGKEDFLKLGVEGIEILSVNQGTQETVYSLTVKELKGKGTIKIGDKSVDYDFTTPDNTNITSVTLDNYRQITVKFAGPVSKESAVNLDNYYFELIQGEVGDKLGAQMELKKSFKLSALSKAPTLVTYLNGELTKLDEKKADEVHIQFDREARLGNYVTGKATVENIIQLVGLGGKADKNKHLDKNSTVYLSTRNIANPEGKLVYDTSVKEILIKDEVNPEIRMVLDKDDKTVEYQKKPFDLLVAAGQKLTIIYNEPIAVVDEGTSDLFPMGLKVLLNGEAIAADKDHITVKGLPYSDMCKVEINLDELAEKSVNNKTAFQPSASGTIQLNGIRDIAGNLAPNLALNYKMVTGDIIVPPTVKPEIKDVVQVKDNMFAVVANKQNITGILSVKAADGDGADVKVVVPYTNHLVDAALIELDPKWAPYKDCYFSLVSVPASGLKESGEMSYNGSPVIRKDVEVNMAVHMSNKAGNVNANGVKFDAFKKPQMEIAMDIFAPKYGKTSYDIATGKLYVEVEDVIPQTYYKTAENKYELKANKQKDDTLNEAGAAGKNYVGDLRLSLSYTADNGDEVNLVDNLKYSFDGALNNVAADGHKLLATFDVVNGKKVLELDLKQWASIGTNDLSDDFLDATKLIAGGKYTVELPEGAVTDEYYAKGRGADLETVVDGAPEATVGDYETKYLAGSSNFTTAEPDQKEDYLHGTRTFKTAADGNGMPTEAAKLVFDIQKPPSASDGQVPQTSVFETAVKVAEGPNGVQELVVLFTGKATSESLRNLENYSINDESLKSLGGKDSDVIISKAEATDMIAPEGALGAGQAATTVVRIPLPKNSIKHDGPAEVTIENIAHPDGGKMAKVQIPAVEGFKDNTSPNVQSATVTQEGQIELTFDEVVKLSPLSTIDAAKLNFEVTIDGIGAEIETLTIDGTYLVKLKVRNYALTDKNKVVVKIKNTPDNIMHVQDQSGNKLDPSFGNNGNITPTFK